MASIDGVDYPIMRGSPAEPVEGMDNKTRLGVDGMEDRLIGLRSADSTIETISTHANGSAAQAAKEAQSRLVGTVATLVDSFDVTHLVIIKGVEQHVRAILNPVGTGVSASDTTQLRTIWTLRKAVGL